jgi:hypothetical protein
MTRPMIRIHNLETNEVLDREMNDDEFAQYEIDQAIEAELRLAELEAQAAKEAAQQKLAVLGLTPDDLRALGL